MNGLGLGSGKVILFGEHFVVHGLPAVVAALPYYTTAQVEHGRGDDFIFIDKRPKVPTFVPTKTDAYLGMVHNIACALGVELRGLRVTLGGDLTVTSGGIGASAAASVAVTRALHYLAVRKLDEQEVNAVALKGEQAIHGTPSGVDNAAAVFGGIGVFKKKIDLQPLHYERLTTMGSLHLVLVDSGKTTDTKRVIAAVHRLKESRPDQVAHIFQEYMQLFSRAVNALEDSHVSMIGTLMNNNHELLTRLGVSDPLLDELVKNARAQGASGAKLTGTGCGGLICALVPDEQAQHTLVRFFTARGYFVMKATIEPQLYTNDSAGYGRNVRVVPGM